MQKADTKLTPQPVRINRRQAVAGVVALPAIAALPIVAVAGADDPDRELVELGNRRRRLYENWGRRDLVDEEVEALIDAGAGAI